MELKKQQQARLLEIDKKRKSIRFLDIPAMLVIGVGIFAKMDKAPQLLHPLLADPVWINSALAIALTCTAICTFISIKLALESNKLKKALNI
ncbi:hypothetical protein PCNPT3_07630 [Psychromonas sp. CNPT3]|uniref:hypothetical protein n=1 Tax=Psychromonas sp. CNPT3 TaxID=314282 RepID=UPI00006E70D4|nr:hypothetical protein [Psychromonas sp. CNPT3]AGH81464.1 hypothetical protein PCNPT3_07630 [Psychromonas sp. CNPT3]